jgi:hypothetical protein
MHGRFQHQDESQSPLAALGAADLVGVNFDDVPARAFRSAFGRPGKRLQGPRCDARLFHD